jgi:hypothetical protein
LGAKLPQFCPSSCISLRISPFQGKAVRRSIPLICHALIVVALTLLTQIGGLAYILAMFTTRRWRRAGISRWKQAGSVMVATLLLYTAASVAIVSPLAALFGRERCRARPLPSSAACSIAPICGLKLSA